jgi:hypothetical protein
MDTTFRILPLPFGPFERYATMTDAELAAAGVLRCVVDANPGYPCRVSLADAALGEPVFLLAFTHHDVASPYRASGPIYVRANARPADLEPGQVPESLTRRLLSMRAYDASSLMVGAEVVEGTAVAQAILQRFQDPRVEYIHLHNARPGCFAAAVVRSLKPDA